MELCLSNQEKNFIIDGVQDEIRTDGRGTLDYRPISLETGVLSTTNGSAKIQIGSTTLLVGVKVEMTNVEDASQCVNRLRFFVDCSAVASPVFAGRGGNDYGEDLARTLYNAYDNDEVLDLRKLILHDTYMWVVYVDIVVLEYGGSVLDAASMGVKAALSDTKICEVVVRPADEGKIILDLPDECRTWSLDVSRAPLVLNVCRIGAKSVINATQYEEACSNSALAIAVMPPTVSNNDGHQSATSPQMDFTTTASATELGRVVCVRKSRGGCLDMSSVADMLETAVHVTRHLDAALTARLADETAAKQTQPIENALANLLFR